MGRENRCCASPGQNTGEIHRHPDPKAAAPTKSLPRRDRDARRETCAPTPEPDPAAKTQPHAESAPIASLVSAAHRLSLRHRVFPGTAWRWRVRRASAQSPAPSKMRCRPATTARGNRRAAKSPIAPVELARAGLLHRADAERPATRADLPGKDDRT